MTTNKFFKKPSVTADVIVQRVEKQEEQILLVQRKYNPYKGMWAIPGGFLDVDKETVKQAGARELEEETGLKTRLESLTFIGESSNPARDERGHIVSLIYTTREYSGEPIAGDDAAEVKWHPLNDLPELAFDHKYIIKEIYLPWKKKNGR